MMPKAECRKYETTFDHFNRVGSDAGLWPSNDFDPIFYQNTYRELDYLVDLGGLEHFSSVGVRRGFFVTHQRYKRLAKDEI